MIQFNDLSRIHEPLLPEFVEKFKEIVKKSQFVLGAEVSNFESELAIAEGSKFAVGVNNGTNALELTLRAMGITTEDEVITSAMTFVATAHAIQESGATCVLGDIERDRPLLDVSRIESLITKRTKALVIVSLHGMIDNVREFERIANKYGIRLILDGAQSHLARFDNRPLTDFFDAVTLSFYPGKNLGALGEAGAILTNSAELDSTLRISRDWGAKEKYKHIAWGGNYRLEPIQASFLRIKLPKLESWTKERKQIASFYRQELPSEILTSPVTNSGDHVYHMFTVQVGNREKLQQYFDSKKIGWGIHYPYAIHQNATYKHLSRDKDALVNSENFARQTFSLPIYPGLTKSEQQIICQAVKEVI